MGGDFGAIWGRFVAAISQWFRTCSKLDANLQLFFIKSNKNYVSEGNMDVPPLKKKTFDSIQNLELKRGGSSHKAMAQL